jgi:hypothetical protein
VHVRLAAQMLGEGLAGRPGRGRTRRRRGCGRHRGGGVPFQLFETELELCDLGVELLAGATELHPLEACELELQMLDQHVARTQLRTHTHSGRYSYAGEPGWVPDRPHALSQVSTSALLDTILLTPASDRQTALALRLLLGHTKLESTVRYLGIEVDDALEKSEQTEV